MIRQSFHLFLPSTVVIHPQAIQIHQSINHSTWVPLSSLFLQYSFTSSTRLQTWDQSSFPIHYLASLGPLKWYQNVAVF